jgi:hypothetical protein
VIDRGPHLGVGQLAASLAAARDLLLERVQFCNDSRRAKSASVAPNPRASRQIRERRAKSASVAADSTTHRFRALRCPAVDGMAQT